MFNKITSEFSEVTKRVLISVNVLLNFILILWVTIDVSNPFDPPLPPGHYQIGGGVRWINVSLSFGLSFFVYWIIVATINWIKKGVVK